MMNTPRDAVQFTRESADRIAGVVRTLELTPARGAALNFEAVQQTRQAKTFRVCTFSGAWAIGSSKNLTFKNVTTTPNTVSAMNLIADVPVQCSPGATTDVLIAKEAGGDWHYVNHRPACDGRPSSIDLGKDAVCDANLSGVVDGPEPQLLLNDLGCPQWIGFTERDVVVDVRIEGGALVMVRKKMLVVLKDGTELPETIIELEDCPAP